MVIMSIERSVPPGTAKEFLEAYSIKLTATERGVMVIKKKDKTRASQRKGALSNWKVRKKRLLISFVIRKECLLIVLTLKVSETPHIFAHLKFLLGL